MGLSNHYCDFDVRSARVTRVAILTFNVSACNFKIVQTPRFKNRIGKPSKFTLSVLVQFLTGNNFTVYIVGFSETE